MPRGLPEFCRGLTKLVGPAPQGGIFILEVLVAALIVAIAAVGLSLMYSTGQALVQAQGANRVAVQLAQQRIEQVRAGGFGPQTLPDLREEPSFVSVPNNPGYERTTVITGVCPNDFSLVWSGGGDCVPSVGAVQAKRIVVTVRANNGQTAGTTDPQTQPATMQMILVHR